LTRIYLDHNVSLRLLPPLRDVDQAVISARDLGYGLLTDDAHLLIATRESRVLVSHDRDDFTFLHDAWLSWPTAFGLTLPPHPGIIILDLAPYEQLAHTLNSFLHVTTPAKLANQRFWWHRLAGWRRRLASRGWEPYT
jgi:hypothetical protein